MEGNGNLVSWQAKDKLTREGVSEALLREGLRGLQKLLGRWEVQG